MANKYFINDNGAAIYYDGQIWTRVGTSTTNLPNASMVTGVDVGNLAGYTFSYADPQGKTVYTAEEMGVAEQIIGQYSANVDTGGVPEYIAVIASAPQSGVVRVWNNGGGATAIVRVNGVQVWNGEIQDKQISAAVNVAAGDLVEHRYGVFGTGQTVAYALLIPFTYTNPG